jgi:DNA polymerase-3 subunit alpha
MHNTDKLNVYKEDIERLGYTLFPPDINASEVDFKVERQENGASGIRYALAAIKNVGANAMEGVIIDRSKNGPYKTLSNFATRIDPRLVNKRQMENLVASGAFDSLHNNRKQVFEAIDPLLALAQQTRQEKNSKQGLLFGGSASPTDKTITLPTCMEWSSVERLQKEFDALGFYLSAHPLDTYKDLLPSMNVVGSGQFMERATPQNQSISVAGIILSKQERSTKTGQKFAFVTLTDLDGVFDVAFFSETYTAVRDKLISGQAVYITANLKADGDENYRLVGQSLEPLDKHSELPEFTLTLRRDINVKNLSDYMNRLPKGKTKVSFKVPVADSENHVLCIKFSKGFSITPEHKEALESFQQKM